MNPKIWGPAGWKFLHSITLHYPENPSLQDKQNYKKFFESLQFTIPCEKCKNHYQESLQKYSLDNALNNKEALFNWLVDIHNEVNKKNNKKVLSYEEVKNIYEKLYSNKKNKNIYLLIIIVLIIIIFYLINNKCQE